MYVVGGRLWHFKLDEATRSRDGLGEVKFVCTRYGHIHAHIHTYIHDMYILAPDETDNTLYASSPISRCLNFIPTCTYM